MICPELLCIFQSDQFEVVHRKANDTGLVYWGYDRSCKIHDDLLIKGKTSDDSPAEFHIYNENGMKIETFKLLCQHDEVEIIPLVINCTEYLAISCDECHNIRLYNMDTATISEAWHDPRHRPGQMCHGPQGTICAVDGVKGQCPVLILDSTSIPFQLEHVVQTRMERFYSISYVPTADLLLITSQSLGIIRAVSCFTDKLIWEVTGEIDGLPCNPYGLVYSSQHDVVFVCNGVNRILVLAPISGECVQTIDLSQHVTVAWEPHLYEDQLILYYRKDMKPKLSYYTVSIV